MSEKQCAAMNLGDRCQLEDGHEKHQYVFGKSKYMVPTTPVQTDTMGLRAEVTVDAELIQVMEWAISRLPCRGKTREDGISYGDSRDKFIRVLDSLRDATANATPELHLSGKSSDHIWLMEDGAEPHVIGVRMDCGDSGTVYLTRKQAESLRYQLGIIVAPELRKPSVEAALRDSIATMMFYGHGRNEEGDGCSCGWRVDQKDCRVNEWQYRIHLAAAILEHIADANNRPATANPAPDAEVGEAVEITRLRTIVSISQMGRIQKTHASELLSELRVLLAAYDALKAAQGELRGASITVAFRHRLAQLFHLKLAAAQNLEYEDGDTCSDCNSAVNDELLPILIEHGLINGDATANPEAAQQQAVDAATAGMSAQLEHDRFLVAECVTAAIKAVRSRDWLTEGRGSYEWDDDKWHDEFKAAAQEFLNAIAPMWKVAADWKDCPTKWADIQAARAGAAPHSAKPNQTPPSTEREICDGCNVIPPWEHRCHGRLVCGCKECANESLLFLRRMYEM